MKNPVDVTYVSLVTHDGRDIEAFIIELVQEDPSYSEAPFTEHILTFETRAEVEKFCAVQGLEPVYDDDAQDELDGEGDDLYDH